MQLRHAHKNWNGYLIIKSAIHWSFPSSPHRANLFFLLFVATELNERGEREFSELTWKIGWTCFNLFCLTNFSLTSKFLSSLSSVCFIRKFLDLNEPDNADWDFFFSGGKCMLLMKFFLLSIIRWISSN